jgi:hypothetical protein
MPRPNQKIAAKNMIEAVGYLISVAARWQLASVVTRLDNVRCELLSVVANDTEPDTEKVTHLHD